MLLTQPRLPRQVTSHQRMLLRQPCTSTEAPSGRMRTFGKSWDGPARRSERPTTKPSVALAVDALKIRRPNPAARASRRMTSPLPKACSTVRRVAKALARNNGSPFDIVQVQEFYPIPTNDHSG